MGKQEPTRGGIIARFENKIPEYIGSITDPVERSEHEWKHLALALAEELEALYKNQHGVQGVLYPKRGISQDSKNEEPSKKASRQSRKDKLRT